MEAVNELMSSDPSKHLQELGQRLDILRRNEGFCDIKISVKGKQFTAHKAVLAASSPFFLTLLNSDMKESSEKLITVELEEATEAVMEDVLKYVYTGNLLVTEERAHNLIATANYLLLPGIKTMAESFLKNIVTTENCMFNYYFAEKYQCLELKEKARQVINSNFTDVMETEDFLKLEAKQVLEWVSSDDIIVNAEDDVFKGIVRWVSHSKSEREGDFPELLHQIRLISISHDFLLKELLEEELITKNYEFGVTFLADAMKVILNSNDGHIHAQPRKCLEMHMNGIFVCGGRKALSFFPKQNNWCRLADAPYHLQEHFPVQCKSKVYIADSQSHKIGESVVMEYYEPAMNTWVSVVKASSFANKTNTHVLVLNDVLYGLSFNSWSGCHICQYNAGTNNWLEMKAPCRRDNPCVVSDEEHIYVIGGVSSFSPFFDRLSGRVPGGVLSTASRFDPHSNKWEVVASLNEGRCRAFGAAMGGKIYVAGGRNCERESMSSCEVYNPSSDEWQLMPSLNVPRCNASMVCCDGRLYVLGGTTLLIQRGQFISSRPLTVEEFDAERKIWVDKSVIPVESFETSEEQKKQTLFQACFARFYKQVIDKLHPIN
ncbi:kelch-like protein 3 [Montipora capricornis]|uniref:kelch-like protein 3 n=1 Tax=Montipora capricornis TaxID=246305 RepID=UPI0035F1A046